MKIVNAVIAILISALFVSSIMSAKQEAPARPMRQWQLGQIGDGDYYKADGRARIDVFDTEGVCLYVARGQSGGTVPIAITAVPKTQLPKGTGCQ